MDQTISLTDGGTLLVRVNSTWLRAAAIACVGALAHMYAAPTLSQTAAIPPERVAVDKNNVDVISGAVSFSQPQLSIGPTGYGLALTSAHNSQSGGNDSLSGIMEVILHGPFYSETTISAVWGNQSYIFPSNGIHVGEYALVATQPPYYYGSLMLKDGTLVSYEQLIPPSGPCDPDFECIYYLHPVEVLYPNGLVIRLYYSALGGSPVSQTRVQSVISNAGYQIKYNYQSNIKSAATMGAWMTLVSRVAINNSVEYCDPTADTCVLTNSWPTATYTNTPYSPTGGTTTITDAEGRTTRYTYIFPAPGSGQPEYFRIKTPGSAVDNHLYTMVAYTNNGKTRRRVTVATVGTETWTYTHTGNALQTVTATNPQGKATVYTSGTWGPSILTSVKDPLNRTTTFTYGCVGSGFSNPTNYGVLMAEGNAVNVGCDSRGNLTSKTEVPKAGSGLSSITSSSWTYPATCANEKTCNKPLTFVDGRGAQTDYTYDPTHGGVLTETLPAPFPGGVRPQKRYSYDQFYAYVRNASGSLVPAATPIWLPTKIAECRTTSSCTNGSDEVVTSFEYGATGTVNRLLPRGKVFTAGGVSLRTCYAYDNVGNQISETTPRAGLTACP